MADWIEDPGLTAEEKLARFEALHPEPTRGPLPGGGKFVGVIDTYSRGGFRVYQGGLTTVTSVPPPAVPSV